MKYELKLDKETADKMLGISMTPKPASLDFRKMSDEKLDEFISKHSYTIHILAATAERKRRDDAKAGETETARYHSANRQSNIALWIAVIAIVIAVLSWLFPRAPH